ncbi:hypothetical protein [Pedobacter agri]|uniref:hypothetical protein n=1 Tax=Pedobacter agri TaxID=454586 RepID=UPI00292E137A|nr:hypothetical protein [Pedobacter agri]
MKFVYLVLILTASSFGCQNKAGKLGHSAPVRNSHFKNTLVNKKFVTEKLIGLTNDKSDYNLKDYGLIDTTMAAEWSGNTIKFVDSLHFVSAYQAWCGNDCFTSVFGRYEFVDSLKVRFYTDSITRSGECEAPTVYGNKPPLDLNLVKSADGRLKLNYHSPKH